MESFRQAALNKCSAFAVGTEQSLVPVTYVKDENTDQYLEGEPGM